MSLEIFNKGSKLLTSKQPVDAPLIFEAGDIDGIKIEQSVISADDLDSGSFNETGQRVVPQAFIGQGNMVDDDDLETPDVKEEILFNSARTHFHIYSGENLLHSKIQRPGDYIDATLDNDADTLYDYQLNVSPERDVRAANISKGSFTTVYNFLDQFTDKLRVEDINADGTELKLVKGSEKDQNINSVKGLRRIYREECNALGKHKLNDFDRDKNQIFQQQYVLNFGNNDLAAITSFDFSMNEKVGLEDIVVKFPEDKFDIPGLKDENPPSTRFYPMSNLKDFWVEVYLSGEQVITETTTIGGEDGVEPENVPEVAEPLDSEVTVTEETTPVLIKRADGSVEESKTESKTESIAEYMPTQQLPKGGKSVISERFSNDVSTSTSIRVPLKFKTTGRGAKFTFDSVTKAFVQESTITGDETNLDIEPIYYTFGNDNDDLNFPIRPLIDYNKQLFGKPTNSIIQTYDNSFEKTALGKFNPQTVTVKLYRPLRGDLHNGTPSIERIIRDSYIDKVLVYPRSEVKVVNNFSEPNFKIDMGTYGKSVGTDLKSWNELLDTNLQTSQQIIDKYVSASSHTNINVNYSDFSEFVHYSSAVERVNNFKYKLELVEGFDSRIKTLKQVSGSAALTNISQSITRKSAVVSGMDGWEKWMYTEPSSSLYSHYSSSKFTFQPWPKLRTQPPLLHSATSSTAIHYYNNLIESASYFDAMNDGRLTKTIPASIVEDPLNKDYVLFIDMIGHHFDITWAYVKKLTSINSREEHPYDGMPNSLLYDVAKSMGWKLTHGKDRAELWSYALGTDKFGNPVQSGSLASKPIEQYTNEIWRRIVNNIPYLLKTKGSARAVKALIATYGIPQTFLSIREYGGPVIKEVRQYWEHERFVYHQRFDTDNYLTVPFGKINDIDPITYKNRDPNPIDTIELQLQQNMNRDTAIFNKDNNFAVRYENTSIAKKAKKGNIHFYLSGSSGYKSASINNINLFDSKMGTLIVQREKSVDDITQDNEYKIIYRRNRRDNIIVDKSASIFISGSSEPSYNAAWTGSGTLTVGKTLPSVYPGSALYMSGSIQELRYWAQPLKDIVIDEHTMARESYHGNSPTSSYFDLKFRFLPDSRLKNVNSYDSQPSQHPNQKISTVLDGRILSASLYNFEPDDLRGVTDEYHTKVPSAGANNIMNNKIRLEPNRLKGVLDVDQRKETSKYDSAPNDSNQLGVYLSATKMYNEDIYNHTGYFDIDDYIGDPDSREGFTEQNEQLDYLRRQVFKKYSTKNLINSTIDILARYDFSVFEQIRQTVPARVDYNSGIIIEPHILERPKVKSKAKLTKTEPFYQTVILPPEKPVQAFTLPLSASIDTSPVPTMTYPTYETEISSGMAPNITMDTIPLNSEISVKVVPIMTYPTYDNFKSNNIPNATGSVGAEYPTYKTRLFLTQSSVLEGEYPSYETNLYLTSSKDLIGEYRDYNTKINLVEPKMFTGDFKDYNTKLGILDNQNIEGDFKDYNSELDVLDNQNIEGDFKDYTTIVDAVRSMSADYTNTPDILLNTPQRVVGKYYLLDAPLQVSHSISVTRKDLEDKALLTAKIPYKPSQYKFTILIPSASGDVGFGLGWITGSNGSWNYNPIGLSVINQRGARYARSTNYFYSSSLSASMGLSYSSSLSPAQAQTDDLPLAVFNLRHLGCKMTSDSLTTNSDDTPDGKPVIEVFQADPNVLINTSRTAEEGSLDVDVLTGLTTLNIDELFISKEVVFQRRMEYRKEKVKFRRKTQGLINIEESRRDEFDLRIQNSEDISSRESARQDEFDIVNNPAVIQMEIEEREIKPLITREERDRMMEIDFEGPQEVRFIDGQRVNVPVKYDFVKPKFSGLALKLSELPIEERSEFIEQNEIDEKILKQLDIPMSREEEKKRFNSEERFIKKRGK